MRQLFIRPELRPQTADGTLTFGVRGVQPVRQKQEQRPLRVIVAPQPDIGRVGNSGGSEHIHCHGLLRGTEKIRGGGNVPF